MKYNIIALDPSLISTSLTIEGKNGLKFYNYCRESDATNKKGLAKWFAYFDGIIEYRFITYRHFNNYSDGEIIKLTDCDLITDMIIKDIEDNIDVNLPTKIGIEGYSFGSGGNTSAIFDLVTFSVLLRKKLYDKISHDILVLSPSSLKMESCKLTYKPVNEGKKKEKWVYRNNDGVSAGSLTKHGIYLCIVENENFVDRYSMLCKTLKTEIMALSKIPKPIEDQNDSKILLEILKSQLNSPTGV